MFLLLSLTTCFPLLRHDVCSHLLFKYFFNFIPLSTPTLSLYIVNSSFAGPFQMSCPADLCCQWWNSTTQHEYWLTTGKWMDDGKALSIFTMFPMHDSMVSSMVVFTSNSKTKIHLRLMAFCRYFLPDDVARWKVKLSPDQHQVTNLTN